MTEIKARTLLSPVSAAKREAIIKAAANVFMTSGYEAASMDQIAAAAGVSKQTVYSHFGAKDLLFEGIVKSRCASLMGSDDLPVDIDGDVETVLTTTALRFMRLVTSGEGLTLYRVILAESGRFPELAKAFYRAGPRAATDRLAVYLAAQAKIETIKVDDPQTSAEMFFAMLRDDLYLRCLLGLQDGPTDADIERRARRAVQMFIHAHR